MSGCQTYTRDSPYDILLATQLGNAAADFLAHKEFGNLVAVKENQIVGIPLSEVADKINNQEFPPNKDKCSLCDFKLSCKYSPLKTKDDDFKVTIADLV